MFSNEVDKAEKKKKNNNNNNNSWFRLLSHLSDNILAVKNLPNAQASPF